MVGVGVIVAIAAAGSIGTPIAYTWWKKKQEDRMYGGFLEESKDYDKEFKNLSGELGLDSAEIANLRGLMSQEQGDVATENALAAAEAEAQKALAAGNTQAATAAEKRAEQIAKEKSKKDELVLKTLGKIKNELRNELKKLKNEKSAVNKELGTARTEGEAREMQQIQMRLARIMQRTQQKGMSLAFINRLISQHKAGKVSFRITAKSLNKIEQQIRKGIKAQVIVPEINQFFEKIRASSAQERAEEGAIAGFFNREEQEFAQAQKEAAADAAEKARKVREKQFEEKLIQYDKRIGGELNRLAKTFRAVLQTESKNKQVKSAMDSQILATAKKQFATVEGLIKIYRSQKKNIRIRSIAFNTLYSYIGNLIVISTCEESRIRQSITSIPNKQIANAVLKRLDAAVKLATTIKQQLLPMKQELMVLQTAG